MLILTDNLSVRAAQEFAMGFDVVVNTLNVAPPTVIKARRPRWQKIGDPRCNCGAGHAFFHAADCPMVAVLQPVTDENPPTIWSTAGIKPPRRKEKRGRVPPPIPSYRFVLQFNFTRPINIALWKKISAPKGWKKNPTNATKQALYRGVRFRCDDFRYALSAEDIALLHMRLLMCLQS